MPWIHNVRNTDMVAAVDDQQCMDLLRLFNEPAGRETLEREGVPAALVAQLPLLGISGICNLVSAIKTARYYDLDGRDVMFTAADRLVRAVRLAPGRAARRRTATTAARTRCATSPAGCAASRPTTCAS